MKVVKAGRRSVYVWNFIQLNRSRMVIFLTLFFITVMLFAINIKPYSSFGLAMIPLSYVMGLYAYRSYALWRSGPEGERLVSDELKKLDDSYILVKNAIIPPSKGDIDYILVGPTGIFVIETKNVGGIVSCNGDVWSRHKVGSHGKPYKLEIGSPSNQAKRSAKNLKDFILKHGSKIFGRKVPHIWVYGIIVFTNNSVRLNLKNPTVEVLSVEELNGFVLSRSDIDISGNAVENIADAIEKKLH